MMNSTNLTPALTPDDLILKAAALAENASPGPWHLAGTDEKPCPVVSSRHPRHGYMLHSMLEVKDADPDVWWHMKEIYQNDAAFIAASRTLVPALASALREAGEKNAELEQRAQDAESAKSAALTIQHGLEITLNNLRRECDAALANAHRRMEGLIAALQELSRTDGSSTNVKDAETLASRVRSLSLRALASTPAPAQEGAPETVPKEDWDRACRVIDAIGRNVGRMVTPDGFFADYNLHYVARNRLSAEEKTP